MSEQAPPVDLRPDHWAIVRSVLRQHVPDREVLAFGSRVNWTAKNYSDLDLAILGDEPMSLNTSSALAEALSESDLPFKVDLVDWARIDNQFRNIISRDGLILQAPEAVSEAACPVAPSLGSAGEWPILDDIADMMSGGTPRKSNQAYWNGSIPWLTPKDMGQWSGTTDSKVTPEAIGNGTRLAPREAIFIAVRGMSLHNEIRIVRPDEAMSFNQDIKAIIAKEEIDPLYLYYVIASKKPELLDAVEAAGHGTGRLPTDKLKNLLVPRFDPLTEAALAEFFSSLDDKIELNRRMNETLEATARAIFKDWFVDFGPTRAKVEGCGPYLAPQIWELFPHALGDETKPVGWTTKPLDEVADFLNGLALQKFPALDPEDSLPVIKIAELRGGVKAKSSRASRDVPEKYVVKDGDFLFSWSGSLVAKFWTGGEGALNQHLFKVTSDQYPAWFFSQWVHHHLEEFRAIAATKATTMGHIQRRHLKEAMTNCPPDDALSILGQTINPLIERTVKNELENRTLLQPRDLLLPKLISGEVRLVQAEKVVETVA